MGEQGGVYPVILCGGGGKRLWPLSRRSYPKQFTRLTGPDSLFQATLRRLSGPGLEPPVIVTGHDFRFIVGEQMEEAGLPATLTLVEPAGRNTGPAVFAAAASVAARDPGAILLVAPSDHVIRDAAGFRAQTAAAIAAARGGAMVTFGVRPDRPETGYGYLEIADPLAPGDDAPRPFLRFVEKPDLETARTMLASGRFLWNSGMFCLPAAALCEAFERLAPDIPATVRPALGEGRADLDFFRLGAAYAAAPDISFDYAIMERLGGGTVVPLDSGWNDLGSWRTVWQEAGQDADGVAAGARTHAIGCRDTLLRSEDPQVRLVGIGLSNIFAVAMRDAVLVADMDHAQEVKEAVEALKADGADQAETFPREHRPWGWIETLVFGPRFQVRQIVVRPGGRLSLQSHLHRSEHWVVVAGTARISVAGEERLLTENQSAYVPLGAQHRLENPGKVELRLIEVQSGVYLAEDDIIRYADAPTLPRA